MFFLNNFTQVTALLTMVKRKKDEYKQARQRRIRQAQKKMKAKQSAQIVFLMDCTSSMSRYIEAAKTQITSLTNAFRAALPHGNVTFAFVGYRDYDQGRNAQVLDFTSSPDTFASFLQDVKAQGGKSIF